jgi:hypothetical protein
LARERGTSRERGLIATFETGKIRQVPDYKTPYEVYFKEAINLKIMKGCQTVHLKKSHFFILTMGYTLGTCLRSNELKVAACVTSFNN